MSKTRRILLECALASFLATAAFGLAALYQAHSVSDRPVRADASKYLIAAINLHFHGVYSLAPPGQSGPKAGTDIAPVYPLFLAALLREGEAVGDFLKRVRVWQSIVASLSVLLVYLIARHGLPPGWSFVAGLLVVVNPHLITMTEYLLTETLFIFATLLGLWLAAMAFHSRAFAVALLAGLVLALAAQVRIIGLGLPVLLAASLVLYLRRYSAVTSWRPWVCAATVLLGTFIVWAGHQGFVSKTTPVDSGEARSAVKYSDLSTVPRKILGGLKPRKFAVRGQSHVWADHRDDTWDGPTQQRFTDIPWAYIRWSLYQKFLVLWSFDNAYEGDVYIYPMKKSGFKTNLLLNRIHRAMKWLHWPLLALSMAGVAVSLWMFCTGRRQGVGVIVTSVSFVYFMLALMAVVWLPRYTIPLRPMESILAVFFLYWVAQAVAARRSNSEYQPNGSSD